MDNKMKRRVVITALILCILIVTGYLGYKQYESNKNKVTTVPASTTPAASTEPTSMNVIAEPILDSLSRITKKPFGLLVSPTDSPVQPEKFTGYHTGTDFETSPTEADIAIPVSAVCDGTVRFVGPVAGYGGAAILACTINSQPVTVLYGHIDIETTILKVNEVITKGSLIANLAPADSDKSGGERKHLHLGIHLGTSIEYRGYVQNQNELVSWLNYQELYKQTK